MQDEARRSNDAVATLLLHPRHAGQELVGDVFTQTHLAEDAAADGDDIGFAFGAFSVAGKTLNRELHLGRVVDLSQVVVEAGDFNDAAIGIHHAP